METDIIYESGGKVTLMTRNRGKGSERWLIHLQGKKHIREVVVTDIKMPFGSMVVFMVKWGIVTKPAIIILTVIGSITFGILNMLFRGFHWKMGM